MTSDRFLNVVARELIAAGFSCPFVNDLDALREWLKTQIVPYAKKEKISIMVALHRSADQDADQDVPIFQLFHALQALRQEVLSHLDVLEARIEK